MEPQEKTRKRKTDTIDKANKPDETDKIDKPDKTDKIDKADKTDKKANKGSKVPKTDGGADGEPVKTPRTWAGRWIPSPSDEPQHTRFMAIKHVYDCCIVKCVRAPSAHSNAFYKACMLGFKTLKSTNEGQPLKKEDYVAVAELQVEPFLRKLSD